MAVLIATVLAAAIVLLVPGLAAIVWTRRSMRVRQTPGPSLGVAESIAVSYAGLGASCITLWLAASMFGMSRATSVAAPIAIAALLVLAARTTRRAVSATSVVPSAVLAPDTETTPARITWVLAAFSLLSVLLVAIPFAPFGWARGDGIHRMAMTDWEKHLRMVSSIVGSSRFPPPHPYLYLDPNPSYYFGYHLVAGAIASVGGSSATSFAALWLLTLATAAATPFVVYTFARDLTSVRAALWAAGSSTLLIGFDVVPLALDTVSQAVATWPVRASFAGLRAIIPATHIDYWIHNVDRQFSAPVVATMWAPHQTAAALMALVVLYLLAPRSDDPARSRAGWLLPALLIAALAGLSSYMALGLAVGVATAGIVDAVATGRAPWRTDVFRRWLVPGAMGVVIALPIVPVVTRGSSSGLVFYISPAGSWSNGAIFSWLFGAHQWTNLLDTPAVFLIDLGIIGVLGVVQLLRLGRERRFDPVRREAASIAVAILVLVTFVRPPVGIGNNLYARAPLLAWFILAAFAAMAAARVGRRTWVRACILLCAAGTCYAEVGYLLEGGLFWATPKTTVDALRWVDAHTPRSAVVAIRPSDYENNDGYWLERPIVISTKRLAVLFGADPDAYDRAERAVEDAFEKPDPAAAARSFDALGASVILVRRQASDPPWAAAPCFDVAYQNAAWSVVLRDAHACATTAAATSEGSAP
jgi:hypothetical protein